MEMNQSRKLEKFWRCAKFFKNEEYPRNFEFETILIKKTIGCQGELQLFSTGEENKFPFSV